MDADGVVMGGCQGVAVLAVGGNGLGRVFREIVAAAALDREFGA